MGIHEVVDRQTAETLMAMARSTETRARQGEVLVEHAHSSNHTFTSLKGFWRLYDTLVCLITTGSTMGSTMGSTVLLSMAELDS